MDAPPLQYDLFGEIEAAQKSAETAARDASAEAGSFLTLTPWPGLISWWLHPDIVETRLHNGETKASYRRGPGDTPGWAWATWRDGLRFEAGDTWQGWSHRPRWCIPWAELRACATPTPRSPHNCTPSPRDVDTPVRWAGVGGPTRSCCTPTVGMRATWNLSSTQAGMTVANVARRAYADRLQAWQLALDAVRSSDLTVTAGR